MFYQTDGRRLELTSLYMMEHFVFYGDNPTADGETQQQYAAAMKKKNTAETFRDTWTHDDRTVITSQQPKWPPDQ